MRSDKPELFLALAGHHESQNELKKAIGILNNASLKFKDSEQILFMLGTFQDRSGQFEKSIKTAQKRHKSDYISVKDDVWCVFQ